MAIYSGFSHEKWWFSIAMLVHQRVTSPSHPLRPFEASKTRRCSKPCTSRAFKMGGSAVSNCTSTTAPITWETLPTCSGCDFEVGPRWAPLNNNPLGVFQVGRPGRTLESIGVTSHQHKIHSQNLGINSWKTQLKYLKFWKLKERKQILCCWNVNSKWHWPQRPWALLPQPSPQSRGMRAGVGPQPRHGRLSWLVVTGDGLHNAWGQRCHAWDPKLVRRKACRQAAWCWSTTHFPHSYWDPRQNLASNPPSQRMSQNATTWCQTWLDLPFTSMIFPFSSGISQPDLLSPNPATGCSPQLGWPFPRFSPMLLLSNPQKQSKRWLL